MNFFIKKNSTLPLLVYPISEKLINSLNLTDEMFNNIAVTFSMVNADNNRFKIANVGGELYINDDFANNPNLEKYSLIFRFKEKDTSIIGRFLGEFIIDFLDPKYSGKLKLPISDEINIIISESSTKTTVI